MAARERTARALIWICCSLSAAIFITFIGVTVQAYLLDAAAYGTPIQSVTQ